MTRKIEVIAPQKRWSEQFEQEQDRLEKVFNKQILAIHHIGSTAIKNSKAKPVIDMLMVVKDIQVIDSYNQEMIKIDYECLGENGILGRRFFSKGGDNRSHHLHVFQEEHPEIQRHLLFRDFMNSHSEEVLAYSQLKLELAQKFPYDIESYVAGKDAFIKKIDQKAKSWYGKMK
ncbi:GrpB family protein [Enterococcus sp. AZ101]|uniref:GrpB family protein n=1 Tax=Enterococcus sp. AZ101 TaxID=2774742 RepID=UPI003D2824BA